MTLSDGSVTPTRCQPPDTPIGLVMVCPPSCNPGPPFVAELLEPIPVWESNGQTNWYASGTVDVAQPIGYRQWVRRSVTIRDLCDVE